MAASTAPCKCGQPRRQGQGDCQDCHDRRNLEHAARRRTLTGYTGNSRPPAHSFYICVDWEREVVKFGITNNTERRLATHARGTKDRPFELSDVIAVREYLGEGEPKAWEDAIKAALRDAGATPIVGTEYFCVQWVELIIRVARQQGMWVPGFELTSS